MEARGNNQGDTTKGMAPLLLGPSEPAAQARYFLFLFFFLLLLFFMILTAC